MDIVLPVIFFFAIAIQLFFLLFIFNKLSNYQDLEPTGEEPPLTIIIAASNELENLKELLPLLENQDYPDFEILVADDRSEDGSYDYLLNNEGNFRKVNFLRVQDLPDHYTAKKYAVTLAVKAAKNEWLLFTDADCRPESDQWIRTMMAQAVRDKEIVLGVSYYNFLPGRLNALIRYETFQTAVQYLSFALAKMPFMGVGRNLMYKKSLFWAQGGFSKHNRLLSGDDDLFVNSASNKENTAICISEATTSIPKNTWQEWFVQKRRHLSVGKEYKTKDRVNLGLVWISEILVWLLVLPVFFIAPFWFEAPEWSKIPAEYLTQYGLGHWYTYNNWMRLITGVFIAFILIKWFILAKINKNLGNSINSWRIPFYDFLYAMYLVVFGFITLVSNPQKIKWR